MRYKIDSLADTKKIAKKYASSLKVGDVVKFYGDLGVGKTTFISFLLQELGVKVPVTSPTFSLVKMYDARDFKVAHFDMYRIDTDEAIMAGFDELLSDDSLLKLVEWPDNVCGIYPKNCKEVRIFFDGEKREVDL